MGIPFPLTFPQTKLPSSICRANLAERPTSGLAGEARNSAGDA
jgi:hypothetical protein